MSISCSALHPFALPRHVPNPIHVPIKWAFSDPLQVIQILQAGTETNCSPAAGKTQAIMATLRAANTKLDHCAMRDSHIISLHSRYLRSVWRSETTSRLEVPVPTVEWSREQASLGVGSRLNDACGVGSSRQVDFNWEEVLLQAIGLGESDGTAMDTLFGDWDLATTVNGTDSHVSGAYQPTP
jgi:hypothetical protein